MPYVMSDEAALSMITKHLEKNEELVCFVLANHYEYSQAIFSYIKALFYTKGILALTNKRLLFITTTEDNEDGGSISWAIASIKTTQVKHKETHRLVFLRIEKKIHAFYIPDYVEGFVNQGSCLDKTVEILSGLPKLAVGAPAYVVPNEEINAYYQRIEKKYVVYFILLTILINVFYLAFYIQEHHKSKEIQERLQAAAEMEKSCYTESGYCQNRSADLYGININVVGDYACTVVECIRLEEPCRTSCLNVVLDANYDNQSCSTFDDIAIKQMCYDIHNFSKDMSLNLTLPDIGKKVH